MALVDIQVPDIGDFDEVGVIELLVKVGDTVKSGDIMAEIASLTPSFQGVTYEKIEKHGSVQWPCNESTAELGTEIMHVDHFVRGKGRFIVTEYVATDEKTGPRFPLLLTTGRILSQYNVGAQTRRTPNSQWHSEDRLEIHPHDAEERGIKQDDWVGIESRAGQTALSSSSGGSGGGSAGASGSGPPGRPPWSAR